MAENSTEINQVKDILTALVTSHDTETIRQAETLLHQLMDQHAEKVVECLVILMHANGVAGLEVPLFVRSLAVVLLTKHLPVGEEDLMSRLPEHLQGKIKNDVRVLCCTDAVSDIHS
jgi:hypothetical protein